MVTVPPLWGGGGHQVTVPPNPQFQCDLKKILLWSLRRLVLCFLGQVTVSPWGGGIARRAGGGGYTRRTTGLKQANPHLGYDMEGHCNNQKRIKQAHKPDSSVAPTMREYQFMAVHFHRDILFNVNN